MTTPRFVLCAVLLYVLVLSDGAASSDSNHPCEVKVPALVVGRTPELVGNNMLPTENRPGGNASFWLEYSGVRAMRVWWQLGAWPDAPAAWDARDNSLAMFERQREALRRDPLATIDWDAQERRAAKSCKSAVEGNPRACFVLSELRRLNIELLCPLTVGGWNTLMSNRFPFYTLSGEPDWHGRWAYWRGVYINVFYLARHYDARRFQLCNEPDHRNSLPTSQDEYLARLQIGSDAVRAAVDDVNRFFGKNLQSIISAPVTAGLEVYRARSERPDTRDAKRGWGEMSVAALDADFPGRSMPRRPLFDHYAFQNYSRSGASITESGARVLAVMREDRPGGILPIIVTETNVSTARNFLGTDKSLDTPEYYSAVGEVAAAYTRLGLREFYFFRFTQTDNFPGRKIKKNGMHVVDYKHPLRDIVRSTKGAEAARVFARTIGGGLELMDAPTDLPEGVTVLAARDARAGEGRVLIANTGEARRLRLNFSAWNFAGAKRAWIAEEVSGLAHGAITQYGDLTADGILEIEIPATSNIGIRAGVVTPGKAARKDLIQLKTNRERFSLAGTGAAQWLGLAVKNATNISKPRIVRAWLEDGAGKRLRLLGHIVIGGSAGGQWLELLSGETGADRCVLIEPDEPGQDTLPMENLSAFVR